MRYVSFRGETIGSIQRDLKGTGYFFLIAIVRGAVIERAHAENPARAAGWFSLSCDQSRKRSRDHTS